MPPSHPHAPNWLRWLGHFAGKPVTGLELGTWKGESAEWMCENICVHPYSGYWCIDTFEGSEEHHARGIDCSSLEAETTARLARFKHITIFRKTSRDGLVWLAAHEQTFHFIYIDAAHDTRNVLRDAVLAFDLLVTGGIMIFDDYTWADMPDPLDRPRLAIDAFLACYARQIEVLEPRCSQIAVRKIQS
jgi:predicted O-methyltransferase YrrM